MALFDYVKQFVWSIYTKVLTQIFANKNEIDYDTIEKAHKCHDNLISSLNNTTNFDKSIIVNNIENSFRYAEEEVEIRIESVKAEFETIEARLYDELDSIKMQWLTSCKMNRSQLLSITNRKNRNKGLLKVERELQLLRERSKWKQVDFAISARNITDRHIGETILNELKLKEINCRIKSGKYKIIDIEANRPFEFCAIQNCYFLLADRESIGLTWFDKSYKIIKKIENINGELFQPFGVATSESNDTIYISDWLNNRVIKTDCGFNQIACFGGTKGNLPNELNGPWGIFYHNESLYVCDHFNYRIQKLSSDLKLEGSYNISVLPYDIKVSNNYACVRCYHSINFYELSTFKLMHSYHRELTISSISQIHSKFCEYYDGIMYYYNENGELREKVETGNFGEISFKIGKNGIAYFNDIVVLFSSGVRNKLVLI